MSVNSSEYNIGREETRGNKNPRADADNGAFSSWQWRERTAAAVVTFHSTPPYNGNRIDCVTHLADVLFVRVHSRVHEYVHLTAATCVINVNDHYDVNDETRRRRFLSRSLSWNRRVLYSRWGCNLIPSLPGLGFSFGALREKNEMIDLYDEKVLTGFIKISYFWGTNKPGISAVEVNRILLRLILINLKILGSCHNFEFLLF